MALGIVKIVLRVVKWHQGLLNGTKDCKMTPRIVKYH